MGRFREKLREVAGESRFSALELERIVKSDEDVQSLKRVKDILKTAKEDNEAIARVNELGEIGVRLLIRLARKALVS